MIPLVCQLNGGPIRSSEVCVFESGHQLRFHGFRNSLEEAVEEIRVRDGAGSVAPSADPNVARACSLEVTECSLHRGVASWSVEPRLELPKVLGGRENVAADFVHGTLVAVGSSMRNSRLVILRGCTSPDVQEECHRKKGGSHSGGDAVDPGLEFAFVARVELVDSLEFGHYCRTGTVLVNSVIPGRERTEPGIFGGHPPDVPAVIEEFFSITERGEGGS